MFFKKNSIGISITNKFIKIALIEKDKKSNSLNCIQSNQCPAEHIFELEDRKMIINDIDAFKQIVKNITETFPSKKQVNLSFSPLCSKNFILLFENLPAKKDEILKFVVWNLEKKFKFCADEYMISYQCIGESRINNKLHNRILISCIETAFLSNIKAAFKQINLKIDAITLLPFSLLDLYLKNENFTDKFELFLCMFNKCSSIMILDKGTPVFYRDITNYDLRELYSDLFDTVNYFFDDIENIYGRLHHSQRRWIDKIIIYDEQERYGELREEFKEMFEVEEVEFLCEAYDHIFFSDAVSSAYYSMAGS